MSDPEPPEFCGVKPWPLRWPALALGRAIWEIGAVIGKVADAAGWVEVRAFRCGSLVRNWGSGWSNPEHWAWLERQDVSEAEVRKL